MNKLSLSCLKSLVQTRPKGDWDFLTKLIQVWPEARTHYWNKQGFRGLLGSWPMKESNSAFGSSMSFLYLPEGKILHGFQLIPGSDIFALFDQGEPVLKAVGKKYTLERGNTTLIQKKWQTTIYQDPQNPILLLDMDSQTLDQLYKDIPRIKQRVIRALNLARELGETNIQTLNTLAARTCKA